MRIFWQVAWLFALILIVGCPWLQDNTIRFTSADLNSGFGIFRADDGVGAAPEGDEGGAEPERTIVEPDIVRRDGNVLYVLNQFRGLTTVDLDTDEVLDRLPFPGAPRDLYIEGDRAYVLVSNARDVSQDGTLIRVSRSSRLYVLDITDPGAMAELGAFDIEGGIVDSRIVGDVLYVVGAEQQYYSFGALDSSVGALNSFVMSVNVSDPESVYIADQLRFEGSGHVLQLTSSEIFVASRRPQGDGTDITVIDISDSGGTLSQRGVVAVVGHVADRFKMDAWEGTLRVVTSVRGEQREVVVTTIALDTLEVLTELRLEDASGDSLFATRFDGPLAYIVTYFQVDPLFVVDLGDPTMPLIREPLEVPGFSLHIEALGDRLITLGVDDSDGTRRVGVSLFDVSGDPVRIDHVSFGAEWSWSSAFSDVKAFTLLDDLVIVPFSGWAGPEGGFDRLQFVSYTRDSLTLEGHVDLDGSVLRSFEYEEEFFALTQERLSRIDGSDIRAPKVVSYVTLAENLVDFLELTAGGVEVITRYDDRTVLLRSVDESEGAAAELVVDVESYITAFVQNDVFVLVGSEYDENGGRYRVLTIDFSNPERPNVLNNRTVDIEPYFGNYYPVPYEPRIGGVAGDALFAPYPYPTGQSDSAFLLRDKLVLHGSNTTFRPLTGEYLFEQVLAVLALPGLRLERTISLDAERFASLDQAGEKLYLGTKEQLLSIDFRARCAFYLQEIDVLGGREGRRVNVPGGFVQYNPDSDVLVLQDYRWTPQSDIANYLESVSWDGNSDVEQIDSLVLPQYVGTVVGANSHLYWSTFNEGFSVIDTVVGLAGRLEPNARVKVSEDYGSILGGRDAVLYVTVSGAAVGRYDFSAEPMLTHIEETSGYPSSIRFGRRQDYVPLGYYGLLTFPK